MAALGDAITYGELKAALRLYCANRGYLTACREGAARIDLDGNAVGTVTAAEVAFAAARLAVHPVIKKRINGTNAASSGKVTMSPAGPKRLSIDDLKEAARRRRQQEEMQI